MSNDCPYEPSGGLRKSYLSRWGACVLSVPAFRAFASRFAPERRASLVYAIPRSITCAYCGRVYKSFQLSRDPDGVDGSVLRATEAALKWGNPVVHLTIIAKWPGASHSQSEL